MYEVFCAHSYEIFKWRVIHDHVYQYFIVFTNNLMKVYCGILSIFFLHVYITQINNLDLNLLDFSLLWLNHTYASSCHYYLVGILCNWNMFLNDLRNCLLLSDIHTNTSILLSALSWYVEFQPGRSISCVSLTTCFRFCLICTVFRIAVR